MGRNQLVSESDSWLSRCKYYHLLMHEAEKTGSRPDSCEGIHFTKYDPEVFTFFAFVRVGFGCKKTGFTK